MLEEGFNQLLVILNAVVDENMDFLLRVVHREDFVEEFLQEGHRTLDEECDEHCEGRLLCLILDVVLFAPLALSFGECACEVISVVVEMDFARSVAMHDRRVGAEFLVDEVRLALSIDCDHHVVNVAIQVLEHLRVVIELDFVRLAELLIEVGVRVEELIVVLIRHVSRAQDVEDVLSVADEHAGIEEALAIVGVKFGVFCAQITVWPAELLSCEDHFGFGFLELLDELRDGREENYVVAKKVEILILKNLGKVTLNYFINL